MWVIMNDGIRMQISAFVDGELPLFVVIMVFVLLPFLHVFLIMALAVVGYTDTWFRYRRRVVTVNEE